MTDTLPKMHVCKNCGFMSTREHLFDLVNDILLCVSCIQNTSFPREATEANIACVDSPQT